MTRQIAFLDIDGTILDTSGSIPESTVRAVREARANGHLVFLATGRGPTEIGSRILDIGFDGAILGAGAYTWIGTPYTDGSWHEEHLMHPDRAAEMIAVFREVGADYMLQGREGVWTTQGAVDRMCARLAAEGRLTDSLREVLIDRVTIDADPPLDRIAKATFSSEDHGTYGAVKSRLGGEFMVITGTMPGLGTAGGEVSVAGVTKGAALVSVIAELGLDRANSIAIGDNNNDLEMLAAAGVGIAMGNATPEALAAADETTAHVDHDGIWAAFERHGLVQPD
ncbi:HAD hydrolase family protein [Microbacterium gubbeenense]|uniref:HAD hydrolase family protein n=1 Tax=Microbacterium gubbeenense TaxID=159896 RepID=UPI003F94CEAA